MRDREIDWLKTKPAEDGSLFDVAKTKRDQIVRIVLKNVDRFVDLSEVRARLEPYYSEVGRPSIDPELMIRMLIVGYCFGVRSEQTVRGGPPEPLYTPAFCHHTIDIT
jgi:hypothetical protein